MELVQATSSGAYIQVREAIEWSADQPSDEDGYIEPDVRDAALRIVDMFELLRFPVPHITASGPDRLMFAWQIDGMKLYLSCCPSEGADFYDQFKGLVMHVGAE